MDKRIQNLLGLDRDGNVFAVSKNGNYMTSRDGGFQWMSMSPVKYSSVSDSLYDNT